MRLPIEAMIAVLMLFLAFARAFLDFNSGNVGPMLLDLLLTVGAAILIRLLRRPLKVAKAGEETVFSEIAHQIGQPIQVLFLSSRMLSRVLRVEPLDREQAITFTSNIEEASDRLNRILLEIQSKKPERR